MNKIFIKLSRKLKFKKVLLFLCIFSLMISISVLGADFKLRVITKRANVRLKASLNSDILSQVPLGAILESEGKVGNWYKVNLPADESGFVVSGYIYESIVEEVIQEFKEPTIKEESPPVVNEERESYIQQKSPVTEKKPIKKYSFRCGLGLSFPSGEWSDLFGLGLGLSVGSGISIVRQPMFDIDLLGNLEAYIFFREAGYTDISWTRFLLSGDCRFSLKVDPITVFAQGGLGVYLDVLTIEYLWWEEKIGSELRFGPRIGVGVTFRKLEIMAMYHIVKDNNMFTIMGSVVYRF